MEMKTPEQQEADAQAHAAAQEYYNNLSASAMLVLVESLKGHDWNTARDMLVQFFLAGHATGKQEERERIWEAVKAKQSIAEFKDENLIAGAVSCRNLNSIIFGDEKL